MKYGLDFGTTNSSVSILRDGDSLLLPIDPSSKTNTVARSALYYFPRKLIISNKVNLEQLQSHTFKADQVHYEGDIRTLIGSEAVNAYLEDNTLRHPGIKRKIYTGKVIKDVILWVTPSGKTITGDIPEYYEEIDFGTGRLFHALKTALKQESFKGNRIFGEYLSLEQLIGKLITEIKNRADQAVGQKIDSVVCGRPVKFSPIPAKDKAAQDRLENALKVAGFKNIEFQFEPIGAAKYYLSKYPSQSKKILVFDFGGGTFDTTVMENKDGFQVLATDGEYIGGDLLNSDIFYHKLGAYFGSQVTFGDKSLPLPTHIMDSLKSWYAIPNLNNPQDMDFLTNKLPYKCSDQPAIDRLLSLIEKNLGFEIYEAIEIAKKQLTYQPESQIVYQDGNIDINVTITKTEFEKIIQPRVEKVRDCVLRTLRNAHTSPEEIGVVVRTGGSSLIPVFENMLYDIFGKDKVVEFDPFTSVAAGLCL